MGRLTSILGGLGLLSVTGCIAEAASEDEVSGPEATEQQGLRSGGGSLPWKGTPAFLFSTSGQLDRLSVIWEVQVGMTRVCSGGVFGIGQECHHELQGMLVSSYSPSNPSNFFTPGDPVWHKQLGKNTAGSWTRVVCPGGTVVSGYHIWSQLGRIEKLQIQCRDLVSGVSHMQGSQIGSTSVSFRDALSCGDYVKSIEMNHDGKGMGATCVRR